MKRRTFLMSVPLALVAAGRFSPFRQAYERAQFAQDMACEPASAYKPGCGESEGEAYGQGCPSNFKPGQPCPDAYVQRCIPASAIKKSTG